MCKNVIKIIENFIVRVECNDQEIYKNGLIFRVEGNNQQRRITVKGSVWSENQNNTMPIKEG